MKRLSLILVIFTLVLVAGALGACEGGSFTLPWGDIGGECEHVAVVDPAIEATCEQMGRTEGSHCSKCGQVLVEQSYTPFKSHTYDDKYDETCNICGYVRDAACAHANTKTISGVAATCKATGLSDGVRCADCDAILVAQVVLPTVEHTYDDKYDTTCNVCGYVRDAACSHKNTEVISAIEATCEKMGLTEGKRCTDCGEVLIGQSLTPFKSHTYDDKYDDTCNVCGYVRDAVCAHENTRLIVGVAATCTTTGLSDWAYCPDCNAILMAQTVIPATGHSEDDWIIDTEATFDKSGSKHTECTVCGTTIHTAVIPRITSEGLSYRLNSDRASYTVVGIGACVDCDLFIPDTYNGLPVTAIGDNAFNGCSSLQSITIPDSVKSIGEYAFSNCTSLESVMIGEGVTTIASYTFYECISLEIVEIPESVRYIDNCALGGCTSLKEIHYDGTYIQWRNIRTDFEWDLDTPIYIIYCTDDTFPKR